MKYIFNESKIEYSVRELVNAYLPKTKFETSDAIPEDDDFVYVNIENTNEGFVNTVQIKLNGKTIKKSNTSKEFSKTAISTVVSEIMFELTGISLPWGILTGIRPAKMVRELLDDNKDYNSIYDLLVNNYKVSPQKANLALEVAKAEEKIIKGMNKDAVSLYIGIPFCPTRCLYCSFTSQSIKFSNTLVEPYMKALYHEIDYVADYIKSNNIPIETIYIGGGTPTALDERNLKFLMDKLATSFDLDSVKEFTVEAGRPDTITKDKLNILKNSFVGRISINPQTMNQKTLDLIGRKHSPSDIINTYNQAVNLGFNHINMDLIAGLPDESVNDFIYTINEIKELDPASVTIHTLAVKHGSYLDMNYNMYTPSAHNTVSDMLIYADENLKANGKMPYYMYRQKNMIGNLENIGYCNKGSECLYNIYIMDEVQNIISLGAGASSKIIVNDRIERAFNVKEVSEYIKRIDEMIDRKKKLLKEVN